MMDELAREIFRALTNEQKEEIISLLTALSLPE